jgi:restriction endonuclease Mrr
VYIYIKIKGVIMTVAEIKRDYKLHQKRIKAQIPEILSDGPLKRKLLIDAIVERSPLSETEKNDMTASGILSLYRSIAGTAIQALERYGDIEINEYNEIKLKKAPSVIVREAEIARYLLELLKESTLTAKQISDKTLVYFGADKTEALDDDEEIEHRTKYLLKDLVKRGKLQFSFGKYALCPETIIIKKPKSLFEEFIAMLNSKGGEFFENYSAMLLDKYYQSIGMRVGYCNVIGGSDDGGIDVILTVSDHLGFQDKIVVQCKQKNGSNVTLKELKEFVGAFYVEKATRGIFMTTSRFHKDASLLFAELGDIIPIDAPKLFEIAKACECGLKKENDTYLIDKEMFAI